MAWLYPMTWLWFSIIAANIITYHQLVLWNHDCQCWRYHSHLLQLFAKHLTLTIKSLIDNHYRSEWYDLTTCDHNKILPFAMRQKNPSNPKKNFSPLVLITSQAEAPRPPAVAPFWHPPTRLHLPAAAAARAAAACLRRPADPAAAGIASAPAMVKPMGALVGWCLVPMNSDAFYQCLFTNGFDRWFLINAYCQWFFINAYCQCFLINGSCQWLFTFGFYQWLLIKGNIVTPLITSDIMV